jgi:hypothetical protein
MANLTYRAERALLGALLRNPDALDDIRYLTADDFASDQHREILHAIAAANAQSRDGSHVSFEFAVAFSAPPPGISVRYLQSLSENCPDPANVRAYARMVMESSLRRQLRAHADRLSHDAGDLHYEIGRFSKAAAPDNSVQDFPAHLMRLAHAMWIHATTFDPATEIPNGPQRGADPERAVKDARSSLAAAGGAAGQEQAQQEEEVLADLIQHYWQNSSVPDWLPADAFTAGPRREVYEAIAALTRGGQPIDQLTIEWHLASSRSSHAPPGPAEPGARTGTANLADLHGYIGLLAAVPVADGAATMTGRALLERLTRSQASAPTAGASTVKGSPEPAASPDRQLPPTPGARSHRIPVAAPPPSFGVPPVRQPDLIEPPPGPTRQPGPQPRQ